MPAGTVEPDPVEHELDERFKLLEFSYKEVLDATKHQDDKINRLLTAVAFLTAATLALAGLHGGDPLAARYLVDGRFALPLGLICLAGFLVGVSITVIMLIASLTTPLVFPGGAKPIAPTIRYVTEVESGQIYFNEISRTALPQWYLKWQQDTADLKRERNDSLIRETHNLAVRTEFKYQRSNEAVAVLSFALLSFVLSMVLILLAAGRQQSGSPLTLNLTARAILAAVLFGYSMLQLVGTQRNAPPTVLDTAYPARRWRIPAPWWNRLYAVLTSLVAPELILLPSVPERIRMPLAIAAPLAAWLALGLALPWRTTAVEQERRRVAEGLLGKFAAELPPMKTSGNRALRSWLIALGVAVLYGAVGILAVRAPRYQEVLGLSGAYAAGVVLLLGGVWQIARRQARRAEKFRKEAEQAVTSAGT
ncbi:hypothetical protein [Jatrophihabitans sp.]|uniref:hypothetical protein n=1 Tax=Jatrophihabitans sp. TaxID=1932789 RepID=UPI002F0E03B4